MGHGGKGKASSKNGDTKGQPPAHSWTCSHCAVTVNLTKEWCWQCGQHWKAPKPFQPADVQACPWRANAQQDSPADDKGTDYSGVVQKIQAAYDAAEKVSNVDAKPLQAVLGTVRAQRDSEKTPMQMALEAEKKLALKNDKVAKEEAAIEACIGDIAKLEEEQKQWLGKARGEQQPKPAAAQVAESFNGLQAALAALGSAAARGPNLVRTFAEFAAALKVHGQQVLAAAQ
ncbi:unnamed protein product, partial [Prorocentrum cordatum]